MDGQRFDSFAKALAQSNSRRDLIKAVGAGVVGVLFAGIGSGRALADPGDPGTHGNSACAHFCAAVFGADTPAAGQCTSDGAHGTGLCQACGGATPTSICCTRNASGFCVSYSGAVCPCAAGTTPACCDGICKDLSDDASNCGSCGKICSGPTSGTGTAICISGNCSVSCSGPYSACPTVNSTYCANEQTDLNNCGRCGNVCAGPTSGTGSATCNQGHCTITCSGPTPNACGTACTNVTTDVKNCGKCGTVCLATEQCVGGVCTDEPNGDPCSSNSECSSGNCSAGICCPVGQTNCSGTCVNESADVNHCGGCTNVCSTTVANAHSTCSGGVCSFACNAGFTLCNGTCVANCTGGQGLNTACNCECLSGQKLCNGTCIPDGDCCTDSDCTSPQICHLGTCACPTTMPSCNGACCAVVYGSQQICSGGTRCCVPNGSSVSSGPGSCDSDSCCSRICDITNGGICVASI
jgi:hypothetical protein